MGARRVHAEPPRQLRLRLGPSCRIADGEALGSAGEGEQAIQVGVRLKCVGAPLDHRLTAGGAPAVLPFALGTY